MNTLSTETREFFTAGLPKDDLFHLSRLLEVLTCPEDTSGYDEDLLARDKLGRETLGLSVKEQDALEHFRALSDATRKNFARALEEFENAELIDWRAKVEAARQERDAAAFRMAFAVVGSLVADEFIALDADDWEDSFHTLIFDTTNVIRRGLEINFA
jgi:hypothetical protein